MHRLNGISDLIALAYYCIKYNVKTELITKEEHDALLDPRNVTGDWVIRRDGQIRLRNISQLKDVVFSLRIEDNIWDEHAEHVADGYRFAENSKALF